MRSLSMWNFLYGICQLSVWNRKTLAQNEYHIYRKILLHTHD